MLSIGEVAHGTGVSRRMLRHWEELGLIEPARVEQPSGYRRYARSQLGRVRAVAALRALGFGLDAVADLLAADLTHERLVSLLREREQELAGQVAQGTARLAEVRARLASVERGHTTMSTLQLVPLPALRLAALRTAVRDETEIPEAVAQTVTALRERVARADAADVVLTFDGTADDAIVVTAGVAGDAHTGGIDAVDVAAVREGVSVTLDERPAAVADAWVALDAALEGRGLRTAGVYRQVTAADGRVTLQAEVRPIHPDPG